MKKSKKLLALSLVSLGLVLSGCDKKGDDHVCSTEPEYIEVPVEVEVEVEKKFGVSINAATGTTVTIVDPQEAYSAGSELKFTVSVDKAHLELDTVKYDGKAVTPNADGVYTVIVVNKAAAIETSVLVRGEENLLEVADVDAQALPTTAEALKAALEAAHEKEAKYAASATLESTFSSYSEKSRRLSAEIGHNSVVSIKGQKLYSDTTSMNYYLGYEKGIKDGRYYYIDDSITGATYSRSATVQKVVSDETEGVLASEIKESAAELQASTTGFIDELLEKTFNDYSYGFLSQDKYGWKEITVASELAEDGKSYFATATAYYSSYDRYIEFVAEIDGDGFLKSGHLSLSDYDDADFEEITVTVDEVETTYHKPVEGAEPEKVQAFNVDFVRGYRSRLEKTDLTQYATTDYDVIVNYQIPGEYTKYTVGEDNKVYNSAALTFLFRHKEYTPVFIAPTLIGAKEEGFISWDEDGKPSVAKTGEFTLQFDNGFGTIKEVALVSDTPAAKSLAATLSSSLIYTNESVTLTPTIAPAGAVQDVTVEVKEGSTATVEVTKNDDGTYNVKGTTVGTGTLVVTSVANAELVKEVSFSVEEKPTVESVTNKLTSFTFTGKNLWNEINYVNFNSDGTGVWRCDYMYDGDVVTFNWTLTDSFEIEITNISEAKRGYGLVAFGPVTGNDIEMTWEYNGSEKQLTLTKSDSRIDDFSNM